MTDCIIYAKSVGITSDGREVDLGFTATAVGHPKLFCTTHGIEGFLRSEVTPDRCPIGQLEDRVTRLENRLNGESWKS